MIKKNKKNVLVVASGFPTRLDDFYSRFIYDLSRGLTEDFNMIVSAPYTQGVKKKEKWNNLIIYRFKYFWPFRYQKVCYKGGILFNIERNKFLIFVLPFLFISQFFKIIYLIKKEKIDLIHAHILLPSGLTAGLAAKICQKPLIVTAHGSDILVLKGRIWDKIKKLVINLADCITVAGPKIAQELTKIQLVSSRKIFTIPMGVETSLFIFRLNQKKVTGPIEKLSRPILLFVGRLNRLKGVRYLINALPIILKKFPCANLVIIGSGSEKSRLKSLVYDLGLKEKVFFWGSLSNKELPYYYSQADVFILPSLSEGMGISALEAMSSGCPVVATRIGGLPDVIKDKQNGLLIRPRSSKEISRAVIKILLDNYLRDSLIKQARRTVEQKYDWQIVTNRFKNLYKIYLK